MSLYELGQTGNPWRVCLLALGKVVALGVGACSVAFFALLMELQALNSAAAGLGMVASILILSGAAVGYVVFSFKITKFILNLRISGGHPGSPGGFVERRESPSPQIQITTKDPLYRPPRFSLA